VLADFGVLLLMVLVPGVVLFLPQLMQ
jgi:hypothetical protein